MTTELASPTRAASAIAPGLSRRRLIGFVRRKLQWEFWPAWAAYVPLAPYLTYLGLRHRSLTVFTAANPGMPAGGFVGESKFAILRALAQANADTGCFELIRASAPGEDRLGVVTRFAARSGGWPLVLKPDVGERGSGVAVIRSAEEAGRYLAAHEGDTITQTYHPGLEFGIFYYRLPGESRGRVFSVTEKVFPCLTGDGRQTLRELILNDARAVCAAKAYLRAARISLDAVPAAGERVQLVEIGSHCRGAIFLDGSRYVTAALEAEVDRISQGVPGFHFGRFDVRSRSIDDLRAGRFSVIELNGVSAEATHIYDPAVPIWRAYGAMFAQWRIAFAIGAANRKRGARVASVRELVRLIRERRPSGT